MINKKIINLTKIFLKDYSERIVIFNRKKQNNSILGLLAVLVFCLTYLSVNIISYLKKANNPELFLKIYLPIMAVIMIFQLIFIICNLFYFSKDLEFVLPMPVKPIEILVAKFFTSIGIMYITETMLLIIPMFTYWILNAGTIRFLIYGILILMIFPIFYSLIISIITVIVEKILKHIRNKNITQIIIVLILTTWLGFFLLFIIQNNSNILKDVTQIDVINKYFIIINPIVDLLVKYEFCNIIKILLINILFFTIFYFLGRKLYSINSLKIYTKNNSKNNKEYRYNKIKKEKAYLKNEIKKIFRNTTYFLQQVFNYISLVIIFLFLLNIVIPFFVQQLQESNLINEIYIEEIKLQLMCTVLIIIQVVSTFNNLSITAISRDAKEAVIIKYLPISLYKQFIIKTIPQIVLNAIMIISVFITISLKVKSIPILYYIITFVIAMVINIIYSYVMLLIDCRKPNLNWTNSESITKNSNNKIFQYIVSIAIILILLYFSNILENVNFTISVFIMTISFVIIFIILNKYIQKNINKIFSKIY